MSRFPRRITAAALAVAAAAAVAAPAAHAQHTQQLDVGAQLLRQPKGKPWEMNLLMGATMGMSDNSTPAPVTRMRFSFPAGAKVNSDAFATCSANTLERRGPSACPSRSRIGKGSAVAVALANPFNADLTVFNGPGNRNRRQLNIFAKLREIPQLTVVLSGTLRRTSGRFGYTLDLPVRTIAPIGPGSEASIVKFETTIGGYGRLKGKRVPFVEAPTKCSGRGWPFQGQFTYADGASGTASAHISCTIRATPDS
jgi:hypothetical protein